METKEASVRKLPEHASASYESIELRMHSGLDILEQFRAGWDALLEEIPSATTFSTWEWLAPWWRAFGGSDRLRFLEFRSSGSPDSATLCAPVALAPLAITREKIAGLNLRVLRFMGDGSGDSDNLDLPVRSGHEADVSRELVDWMDEHGREWDVCRLNTLRFDSLMSNRVLDEIKRRGWTCFTSTRPWLVVDLADTWEEYLKTLSSKERGKIGYLARRLEKAHRVRIYRCGAEDQLDTCLQSLFELHGKHWQTRGLAGSFKSTDRRRFYREMGGLLLERGRLEFWLLDLDGETVAAQFGFRHRSTVFALQEGFDPQYSADSVGYVLRSQVIRQLIAEGVRTYDFLAGRDPAKLRWGAREKSYLKIEFARPYTRGSAYLALAHGARNTKAWFRSRLSPRTWQAMKTLAGVRTSARHGTAKH